jgi:heme exporter protein CcmD
MDIAAPHIGFVEVSYGLSGLCLILLCVYILWRDRTLARKLKSLADKSNS